MKQAGFFYKSTGMGVFRPGELVISPERRQSPCMHMDAFARGFFRETFPRADFLIFLELVLKVLSGFGGPRPYFWAGTTVNTRNLPVITRNLPVNM